MISSKDGTIDIERPLASLSPRTTLDEFSQSRLFAASKPLVQNPPWLSFSIRPVFAQAETFAPSVYFHAGKLESVSFAIDRPEFGKSWDDWSEDKELARKQLHEGFLGHVFGSPPKTLHHSHPDQRHSILGYQFPWGDVSSCYDVKGGGSNVVVRYTRTNGSRK